MTSTSEPTGHENLQPDPGEINTASFDAVTERRIQERRKALRPYQISQRCVPADLAPAPLRWPGLRRITISRAENTGCVFGQSYRIAGRHVRTYAVYFDCVDGCGHGTNGFVTRKIVWSDEASGYDCIVMRADDGRLRGFVGVAEDHAAHGLSCAELRAAGEDSLFGRVCHADEGRLSAERRSSLAEEARSPSNRMVKACRAPDSFEPVLSLVRDRRWWFGIECLNPFPSRHRHYGQLELPLPPTSNMPLDEETSAFLVILGLANALTGLEPRRRSSEGLGNRHAA